MRLVAERSFFLVFIYFISLGEQDTAYINSLGWLTFVEFKPAYIHVSRPLYHRAMDANNRDTECLSVRRLSVM